MSAFRASRLAVIRRLPVAGALVLLTVSVAGAQAPPAAARGYAGLFGPLQDPATPSASALRLPASTLTAGILAIVDNVDAVGTDAVPPRPENSATALDLQGIWRRGGRRLTWEARASSQVRRYADLRGLEPDLQFMGLALQFRRDRRTTIAASTRAAYRPQYLFGLPVPGDQAALGGTAPPAGPGLEVASLRSVESGASVGITRRLDARTTADARYLGVWTTFVDQARTVANQRVSARVETRLNARLTVRARYELGRLTTSTGAQGDVQVATHEVDLGVRVMPRFSRGTTMTASLLPSFSRQTSGTGLQAREGAAGGPRLGASASIDREFGGGLRVGVGYQRAFYTDPAYMTPAFLQTASARVESDPSRRFSWSAAISRSTGGSARTTPMPDSYGATAGARFQLLRGTVMVAEYQLAVLQRVDGAVAVPGGWGRLDSRRLRVGVQIAGRR